MYRVIHSYINIDPVDECVAEYADYNEAYAHALRLREAGYTGVWVQTPQAR